MEYKSNALGFLQKSHNLESHNSRLISWQIVKEIYYKKIEIK